MMTVQAANAAEDRETAQGPREIKREIRRDSGDHGMGEKRSHRGAQILVAVLLLLLVLGGVITVVSRLASSKALAKETENLSVPHVAVVHPKPEAPQQELLLPSTLQAFTESPIYARTNGYLAKWYKDIGAPVKKGALLADIETPEVDQELIQAKAQREQAVAQLNLARSSAERWEGLRKMDAVAQQETDERASGYIQGQAALASSDANLKRLAQLESFKHIYAPFSGVITQRNTDIGALVNSGNTGANQQLFTLAKLDPIRVYVDVPQAYSPAVRRGVKADVQLAELVGQHFSGTVVRTADAIDPATRTLRTEIELPNPKGTLFPGAYAQVRFALTVPVQKLSVPVNALLFRAEGTRAAVVGSDGKVHLVPVTIGRDEGTVVEIVSGVQAGDSLVLNPSDSLEDGQQVQVGNTTAGEGGKS